MGKQEVGSFLSWLACERKLVQDIGRPRVQRRLTTLHATLASTAALRRPAKSVRRRALKS
jgi:hypothetical protein